MKNKILFLLLLLVFTTRLFGNDIRFSFDVGEISVGGETNTKEQDLFLSGKLLEFKFEDFDSGVGLSVLPLSFYGMENENIQFGLLNFKVFYDFFHFKKDIELKSYIFSSFVNPQNMDFFNIESGIRFSLFMNKEKFKYLKIEGLNATAGVRFTNQKFSYFFDVGIDIGLLFYFFVNSEYERAKDTFYQ